MKFRSCVICAATLCGMLAGASPAFAQFTEYGGVNMALKKTYIRAASDHVSVSPTFAQVFSPLEISCPSNGNCFVQLQLSASIDGAPNHGDIGGRTMTVSVFK